VLLVAYTVMTHLAAVQMMLGPAQSWLQASPLGALAPIKGQITAAEVSKTGGVPLSHCAIAPVGVSAAFAASLHAAHSARQRVADGPAPQDLSVEELERRLAGQPRAARQEPAAQHTAVATEGAMRACLPATLAGRAAAFARAAARSAPALGAHAGSLAGPTQGPTPAAGNDLGPAQPGALCADPTLCALRKALSVPDNLPSARTAQPGPASAAGLAAEDFMTPVATVRAVPPDTAARLIDNSVEFCVVLENEYVLWPAQCGAASGDDDVNVRDTRTAGSGASTSAATAGSKFDCAEVRSGAAWTLVQRACNNDLVAVLSHCQAMRVSSLVLRPAGMSSSIPHRCARVSSS
jgi:hypothetical protein